MITHYGAQFVLMSVDEHDRPAKPKTDDPRSYFTLESLSAETEAGLLAPADHFERKYDH